MRKSSKPSKSNFSPESEQIFKNLISRVSKFKREADIILSKYQQPIVVEDANRIVEQFLLRFHLVAKQISERYEKRPSLQINDEYDVQDLLHGLLLLYFDDVRREQWTPEHAGASSRVDFLIKKEQIAIEVKKTRKGLRKKKLGEQLIVDIARYQKLKEYKTLYFFIYDPQEIIKNPRGLESDLSGKHGDLLTKVFVVPKRA